MKKEYQNPTTEIVVLNLSEQITKWGDGANPSNTGAYTEAKENSFEEEEKTDYLNGIQFKDIWEDEEE